MLRFRGLLVNFTLQLMVWPTRNHFCHLLVLGPGLFLARLYQYLVAYVYCSVCSRFWYVRWLICHLFRLTFPSGIGPKSATVPVYAAECAPPGIRSALVIQWQMWTAFGATVGYTSDLAFYYVPDKHNITGLNWRIMMASAMLPVVIVFCFVFMCPESPRWYLSKGRHSSAYSSMCRLRYNKDQAARNLLHGRTP